MVGNLTRDPELRQVPSGDSVAELGLAVNERFRNRDGELAEKTCFVDIDAWGRQAETCGQYLKKGAPILVEGRLQLSQWETPEGEKRSKLRIRADRIRFMGQKNGGSEDSNGTPASGNDEADPMPF